METPTIDVLIRVKTQQVVIPDASPINGFPQRHWKVKLCMLDEEEKEIEIDILSRCTFYLHETFVNPVRSLKTSPFYVEEDGWGEFEIKIICEFLEEGGTFTIFHPLSFEESAYAIDYGVQAPCDSVRLKELLSKHFHLPEIDKSEKDEGRPPVGSWISKIATADEDTVSEIVQMIVSHPAVQDEINKRPRHEDFLMSFHQLPNDLLKKIGDFVCGGDVKESEIDS